MEEVKVLLVGLTKNKLGVNIMTVGRKNKKGFVEPINIIQGQRAIDIYNELLKLDEKENKNVK